MDAARRHVDGDQVARLDEGQRAAHVGLGRRVQDAGAVARAAHACVRQAQHVAHALLDQLGRDRQHAPFRHARAALGAGIAQDHDVFGRDVQVLVIDRRLHAGVVIEHQRGAGVLQELRGAGAGLDDAAVRRNVAAQDRQRAFVVDGGVQLADHVIVIDLGARDVLAQRLARHRHGRQVQVPFQARHQRGQAAGVIEVFHQVGVAAGPDVRNDGHLAAGGIKVFQADGVARAARHGHQVDDGVGRAAHGHGHVDGVLERRHVQDALRGQIVPDHFHHTAAAFGGHAHVVHVSRRNRRGAGQRHADGFGNGRHGAGRAHRHAGAVAARDAAFHFGPLFLRDLAGAAFVPELPGVRAGSQDFALPVAAQHGAGGHVHTRQPGADGAHQQARGGLVAPAHQHRAIDRVAAQQLFGFHGQEVAIKHGGGLDERFRHRDRRQLHRKAARLEHAALHVFDALLEVAVTGVQVRPGVDDGDDGPADPVVRAVAHLHHA